MADNEVKHDGLVAKVIDSQTVVLNIGASNGVSTGDEFVVFSLGEEVLDPKTGQNLGILENVKGKGKAVHVQDHLCTIEAYEIETTTPSAGMSWVKGNRYRPFIDVQHGDYARKINLLSSLFRRR